MNTFEVDVKGTTYEVDAPDAKTAWAMAHQAHNKRISEMVGQTTYDPTTGMSGFEKFAAGAGKAFYDIGRGVGELAGVVTPEEIDAARKRDEALMATGAGTAGNIAGNIAATLPAAMIPGAATVPGGALIGGGLGAVQPVGTDESRFGNVALGAVTGGAVPAVVSGAKAARAALYDPLAGQERILAGALRRSIGESQMPDVARRLVGPTAKTPGVTLSAGERSGSEALSAIEDTLKTQIPGGALARQAQINRSQLAKQLQNIAKSPEDIAAAKLAREQVTGPMYRAAGIDFITPTPELASMMKAPPMQEAWARAQRIAATEGIPISIGDADKQLSVQGLHYLKLGLDDMLGDVTSGIGKTERRAIGNLKDRFLNELDALSPGYQAARQEFAKQSRPINQMQIGQKLYETLVPATAGEMPSSLNYASLARALRQPDIVAQQATKFKGATMKGAMSPEQLAAIKGVESDASRIAESLRRGAGLGSPTARRLGQSNLIAEHFSEQAPIASTIISLANKVPGVNVVTRGAEAMGGLLGGSLNQRMVSQLDEMLAQDPARVARLLNEELSRLSATDRRTLLQALPQSVVMALPLQKD